MSDLIEIALQAVPAGSYQLHLGMVDAETSERLPITASADAIIVNNTLWLGEVTIQEVVSE